MSESNLPAVSHQAAPPAPMDFGARLPAQHSNVGAVAIESERAIAEAQGQLVLAKRFPRSLAAANAELMEACKSSDFAQEAFYAVPNRGEGPSIRFAEEVARCYGNFQYGHRELSRSGDKSEIEVFAWDMERNNRSTRQLTVRHVRDTRSGPQALRDQTDIDNMIANKASRQIRGRILALMPKHLVAAGIAECKKTLEGNNDKPLGERINKMSAAFAKAGVTMKMLESRLGHKLDDTSPVELTELLGIYNAITKENIPMGDFFGSTASEERGADIAASAGAEADKPEGPKAETAKPAAKTAEKPAAKATAAKKPAEKPPAQPEPEPETPAEEPAGEESGEVF